MKFIAAAVCVVISPSMIALLVCRLASPSWVDQYHCLAHLADINPIGAISKTDLKKFIAYAKDAFDLPVLQELVNPTWKLIALFPLTLR